MEGIQMAVANLKHLGTAFCALSVIVALSFGLSTLVPRFWEISGYLVALVVAVLYLLAIFLPLGSF